MTITAVNPRSERREMNTKRPQHSRPVDRVERVGNVNRKSNLTRIGTVAVKPRAVWMIASPRRDAACDPHPRMRLRLYRLQPMKRTNRKGLTRVVTPKGEAENPKRKAEKGKMKSEAPRTCLRAEMETSHLAWRVRLT